MATPPELNFYQVGSTPCTPPTKAAPGTAGYDLHSCQEAIVPPRSRTCVRTGLGIRLPNYYYGRTVGRPELARHHGVDISGIVIDR